MFRLLVLLITLLVIDSEFQCMGSIFSKVEFLCLCKGQKSNYFNHIGTVLLLLVFRRIYYKMYFMI